MGIKDLLKFLKPYTEPIHIKKYAGKRVGIDAYSWLHKGAYSCSMDICLDTNGDKKLRFIDYFMHRINLLKHYKVTPVVVFDGGNIPCKAATENERHRRREANRELAMEKLKEGDVNAASELFQRAICITPSMAHQLIQILRSEKIDFVVAPYEADAQLAYLSSLEPKDGGIAAVITEDSDLLAYGCQATIFKMDRYGNGEEIFLDKIFGAVACKPSFQHFDKELFLGMCVLAGCDFLPSVPGIGIVKAHSFVSKYRSLDRVLSVLKLEKGSQMPEDYSKCFKEAIAVFQYARIYDHKKKSLQHMKTPPESLLDSSDGKLDFLGPYRLIPSSVVIAIAEGNLNPTTMEAFDYFPSAGSNPGSVPSQTACKIQKTETVTVSKRKNYSAGISSLKIRATDIRVNDFMEASSIMKQDPDTTEKKYVNEALALQRLISLPGSDRPEISTTEKAMTLNDVTLKIPNNPFMIRIPEKVQLEHMNSSDDQVSIVTEDEGLKTFLATPDSITSNVPSNGVSKKRKLDENQLDQYISFTGQTSEVIQLESSDNLCVTRESQESVNSKPRKILNGKSRGKTQTLRSNHKNSEKEKSTILNFFSRA